LHSAIGNNLANNTHTFLPPREQLRFIQFYIIPPGSEDTTPVTCSFHSFRHSYSDHRLRQSKIRRLLRPSSHLHPLAHTHNHRRTLSWSLVHPLVHKYRLVVDWNIVPTPLGTWSLLMCGKSRVSYEAARRCAMNMIHMSIRWRGGPSGRALNRAGPIFHPWTLC
jgi:hypothetical protein